MEYDRVIRELIYKVYGELYIGKLKVKKLDTGGYDLILGLDVDEKPLHIAADLEWEEFLKYLEQELRSRHLHTTKYYTGYKIDIPNDKRRINRGNQQSHYGISIS